MKLKTTLLATSALLLGVSAAHAGNYHMNSNMMKNWYVGGGFGYSDNDVNSGKIDTQLVAAGAGTSSTVVTDDSDTSFQAFLGYKYNNMFALEGSYLHFGAADATTTITGPAATVATDLDLDGFGIDLVGSWSFYKDWSVFAKLGLFFWETDYVITSGASTFKADDDGTDIKYGFGVQWDMPNNVSWRFEYQAVDVDYVDVSNMMLSVMYNF